MSRVLNLLLSHQSPVQIGRMLAWWRQYTPPDQILLACNGDAAAFAEILHPQKIRIEDERLRTVKHSRERQSYTGVFRAASDWLAGRDFTHVHFAEYDQLPLVAGLNDKQVGRLEAERADVLAGELARVDGTNDPHFLYHAGLPGFFEHWASLSVRADKRVVLSTIGCNSFWKRQAFDAVARVDEPFRIYLELYLPTTAHHLGFRVRDWGDQNRYVKSLGDFENQIETARRDGAWTIHPVKQLWQRKALP